MRIVHVTDAYLPRLGGIELHVADLARQQRLRGHDVVVVTGTRGPDGAGGRDGVDGADGTDAHVSDGVPVVRLRGHGRPGGGVAGGLGSVLRDADVVHCHSSIVSPLAWLGARTAAASGAPVVVTMHSVVQRNPLVTQGLRAVAAVAGRPVVWAAVSGVAARSLEPWVGRAVHVLPNGIDVASWPGVARPARPAGEPPVVVSVGRFAARKRVLPLLDVLADVRRRLGPGTPFRAVLAGDGPQRDAVRQRVRALHLDDVVDLPGRLTRSQVHALHAASDVFVAPARLESFGLAALEARCTGLPVVALAAAGVGEFVADGVEGRLVDDDAGLAAATADLLARPEVLARVREHNATTPPPLDWDRVVGTGFDLYAAAAAAARRPAVPVPAPAAPVRHGMLGVS